MILLQMLLKILHEDHFSLENQMECVQCQLTGKHLIIDVVAILQYSNISAVLTTRQFKTFCPIGNSNPYFTRV